MADINLHKRIYQLEQQVRSCITERDPRPFEAAQARADAVAALHGDRAPPPIPGESELGYRRRLVGRFQSFSPGLEKSRFDMCDANMLDLIEARVYQDAQAAAYRSDAKPGELRAVERNVGGRVITEFVGDVGEFIGPFVQQNVQVCKINRPGGR